MVRGRGGKGGADDQYVNDRPYVASSLLSVVLSRWFNAALGGRCERKPDLVASELPLEVRLAAVPCRGGEPFLARCSSLSAMRSKRRVTNLTRVCRLWGLAGCSPSHCDRRGD